MMEPYDWMVEYTPQKNWIEGEGLLMWLAEVLGIFGGGLYLVSLYLDSGWGLVIGWLLVTVVKGSFHLAHLGRPSRFWRLFLRPRSSWLARGLIFLAVFAVVGVLQLLASAAFPGTGLEVFLKILSALLALLVIVYSGFVMNYVAGIPFWNSALLPLLFVVSGFLGGLALSIFIGLAQSHGNQLVSVQLSLAFLLVGAVLTVFFLLTATYMGPAARHAVTELVRGGTAPAFWAGEIGCGVLLPGVTLGYMCLSGNTSGPVLALAAAGMVIGVFALTYCLLKGGFYRPLTPVA